MNLMHAERELRLRDRTTRVMRSSLLQIHKHQHHALFTLLE